MFIRLVNTKNINQKSLFKNAILNPIQGNNGLWSFLHTLKMPKEFYKELPNKSFNDIAYDISCKYNLNCELGDDNLKSIIIKSFDFPIITNDLNKNLSICELYHGKSKSFKDIGISFTANIIEELHKKNTKLKIVTATTGDTGSAVASAFYDKSNIDIHILYPKNKISLIQKKQMTTYGRNIKCYEVNGNFDDCQNIVKKLLADKDIKNLTTCNSVNIGRILGQLFYYFYTCKDKLDKKINISIPTGNLGNGLSCYIAKEMGLPINDIIFACNENSNLSQLLNYKDIDNNKKNNKTLSNAIDILNPSNYERLNCFINKYNYHSKEKLDYLISTQTNDNEIIRMINFIYYKMGITIDPHTAVAFDGLFNKYGRYERYNNEYHNIIMSTADPIKFYNEIDYGKKLKIPNEINELLNKEEYIIKCSNDYNEIKKYIK